MGSICLLTHYNSMQKLVMPDQPSEKPPLSDAARRALAEARPPPRARATGPLGAKCQSVGARARQSLTRSVWSSETRWNTGPRAVSARPEPVRGPSDQERTSIAEVAITGCTIQHSAHWGKTKIAPGGANIRILGHDRHKPNMITISGVSQTLVSIPLFSQYFFTPFNIDSRIPLVTPLNRSLVLYR